ncbi:hypothetical protein ACAW74_18375 [Fibrella sp. WM1]|uniref:hypothetical protein n=1 Tax=Fibrella musci TaxID=3242485 RepID=UPI00351FE61A
MQAQTLSNLQLELLRTYARQVSDEDVLAIRKLLADYFAQKAMNLADDVWDKNNWAQQDTARLSAEHNRKSTY